MAQALLAGTDVLKCVYKNYKSACAICWENIILHTHPEIEISFKFIPKYWWVKSVYIFLGHSVYHVFQFAFVKVLKGNWLS